jgi:hypothetical protein
MASEVAYLNGEKLLPSPVTCILDWWQVSVRVCGFGRRPAGDHRGDGRGEAGEEGTSDAGWWRNGRYGWDGRHGLLIRRPSLQKREARAGRKVRPFLVLEGSDLLVTPAISYTLRSRIAPTFSATLSIAWLPNA